MTPNNPTMPRNADSQPRTSDLVSALSAILNGEATDTRPQTLIGVPPALLGAAVEELTRLTALLTAHPAPAEAALTVKMDGPSEQVIAAVPEALATLWELGAGRATITLTGRELEWAVQRLGLEGAGVERAVLHVQSAQAQAGGEVSE
ncbi:hypothetical protein [Deinococcus sp. DB0503]|uniref:hypothetical protein n=1 Tax=Deinococcus sp. DB0503 TaxID=2479203 RepID=UPI0018DF71AA|nr:hypothetical protein [Deinococcus sp. DB0503]MBI0447200.1 hypothetical protein [Deinococcus sp. DB0503]